MTEKKPYEPPRVIDLQVDYTQAVGASRCVPGGQATGQCSTGGQATSQCTTGTQASATCSQGPSTTPQHCRNGRTALNCWYGKSP